MLAERAIRRDALNIVSPLLAGGHGHDVEIGKTVEPAGGFGVECVNELDDTTFGVRQPGLHYCGYDLASVETGFDLGH